MDASTAALSGLFARLKKCKPRTLVVTCADGNDRTVEVPAHRNRWKALQRILTEIEWVRVEARNAKGSVVDIIENQDYEPAEEVEQPIIIDGNGQAVAPVAVIAAQLTSVMLRAQDVALKRRTDDSRMVIEAQAKTIDMLVNLLLQLGRNYGDNASRVHELTRMLSELGNGDAEGEGVGSGAAMALVAHAIGLPGFEGTAGSPGASNGVK